MVRVGVVLSTGFVELEPGVRAGWGFVVSDLTHDSDTAKMMMKWSLNILLL